MKKFILASIASLAIAVATLSASTIATNSCGLASVNIPGGFSSITVAYVDTRRRDALFASISDTKINVPAAVTLGEGDSLAVNTQKPVVLTTIVDAEQKSTLGQNLFVADHRLGSDSLKALATHDASQFLQQNSASGVACTLVSVSHFNFADALRVRPTFHGMA